LSKYQTLLILPKLSGTILM